MDRGTASDYILDLMADIQVALGVTIGEHMHPVRLSLVVECYTPEWATQVKSLEKQICEVVYTHTNIPIESLDIRVRRTS